MKNHKKEDTPHLLGQGTYGCVYHPGINCNHKPLNAKYVTKIHSSEEKTIQNEIAISKKIQTITNYELYFSPILENCDVNLAKVDKEEVEKCDFVKKTSKRKNELLTSHPKFGLSKANHSCNMCKKTPNTPSFLFSTKHFAKM